MAAEGTLAFPDARADRLLGGRVRYRQPAEGLRAALDPVLLAAAAPARPGFHILDLGAGAGAAGLCLAARAPGAEVTCLERSPDLAAMAAANARANGWEGRVRAVAADAFRIPLGGAAFDAVITNPPHLPAAASPPPSPARRRAMVEDGGGLEAWTAAAFAAARPGGWVVTVHRADALARLVAAKVRAGAGGIAVLPVHPRAGGEARRILVAGRRGSRSPSRVLAPLVLHGPDGGFTRAAEDVLRGGAEIPLVPGTALRRTG